MASVHFGSVIMLVHSQAHYAPTAPREHLIELINYSCTALCHSHTCTNALVSVVLTCSTGGNQDSI